MIFVKFMSKIFWTVLVMLILIVSIVGETLWMFIYLPFVCLRNIIKKEGNNILFLKDFKEELNTLTNQLFEVTADNLRRIWRVV